MKHLLTIPILLSTLTSAHATEIRPLPSSPPAIVDAPVRAAARTLHDRRPASGQDVSFVIDVSQSMEDELQASSTGLASLLGELGPGDRFRLVVFSDRARPLTPAWVDATPGNVQAALERFRSVAASPGSNLYHGLHRGLEALTPGRPTSLVLITDGAANTGVLDPRAFRALTQRSEARLIALVFDHPEQTSLVASLSQAENERDTRTPSHP